MTDDDHSKTPDEATATTDDPTFDSPRSDETIREMQSTEPSDSPALDDDEIDADAVKTLPGTGGPDDVGEIEVDPSELNLSGDSIPGHPKPE